MENRQWTELSIQASKTEADEIASLLSKYGQGGAVIEKLERNRREERKYVVKIYLPHNRSFKARKSRIEQAVREKYGFSKVKFNEKLSLPEDWFKSLKQEFNILEAGSNFVIKATWADGTVPPFKKVIILDPGYAFGTGLHPTTRLCLVNMEKNMRAGMTVLDLGTGSGILAIAAAKLGASSVLALDKDDNAVRAALNNIDTNSENGVVSVRKGVLSIKMQRDWQENFDLVVVNIISRVIANLAAGFHRILKPGGKVIASGINAQGLDDVLIRFALADLTIESIYHEGEWYVVIARKGRLYV